MMAAGGAKHISGSPLQHVHGIALLLCCLNIANIVSEELPEFLEQPESQILSHNAPVTLKCSATPDGSQIRWLFDGQPLDERRHTDLEIVGSNLRFLHTHLTKGDNSNDGEYRCTATTAIGTIISQPAILSKPELSRFTHVDDVAVVVPEGGFVTLTCEPPSSSPPAIVLFQRASGEILDTAKDSVNQLPSGNVVLSNVTSATAGDFRCVAVNPVSRENRTSAATISVLVDRALSGSPPRAYIMPAIRRRIQVEIGSDVTLECPSYGHREANITWSKYGTSLPIGRFTFSAFGNLKIHSTQYEDSGMYRCSSGGAGDEEQVHLEILTPPVIQVVKEPQAVVEIGSRVEMGCSVVGFPKPELQWFHNGRELDNKGKGNVILAAVSAADAGIYQCMATNRLGTAYGVTRLQVRSQHRGLPAVPENLKPSLGDDEDEGISSGHSKLDDQRGKLGRRDRRKNGRQKTVQTRDRRKKKKNGLGGHGDSEKPKYAPSVPTVAQLSDRSVMLNWSVLDKGNGQTIKFFKVQYKEMSPEKGPWRTNDAYLAYNVRRFEVADLKSGGSYKFRILAVYEDDDNKNSANTPIFKLTVQPHAQARAPDTAPTIVEAKPIVYQQNFGIGVKWQYKAETASPIEGFIIFYKPFEASEDKEKLIPGAGIRNDVIRDLLPNTPYNIRMQSFNTAGRSQFSNQVVKTTKVRDSSLEEDYLEPELPQKEPETSTEAPVSSRRSSETLEQPVILGVVLGALILALFILVTMCWWKQRQQKRRSLPGSQQQKVQDQSQCIFADNANTKQNGGLYMANGSVPIANGLGSHSENHSHMNVDINPLAEYDMQMTIPADGRPKQFYGSDMNGSIPRFGSENGCSDKFKHSSTSHIGCNGGGIPCMDSQKSVYRVQHRTLPLTPNHPVHMFYSEAGSLSPSVNHEYSELDRELPSPGVPHSVRQQTVGQHANSVGHMRNFDYNWSGSYDQPHMDKSHFSSGERLSPLYSPTAVDFGKPGMYPQQQRSSKCHLPSLPKSPAPQVPASNFGTLPEHMSPSSLDPHRSGKHKHRRKRMHTQDPGPREHAVRDQATNTDLSSNEGTFDFDNFCRSGSSSNSGSEVGGQNCDSSFANNGSLESMNEDSQSAASTVSLDPGLHLPADLPVPL